MMTPSSDEKVLLQCIAQGDEAAFGRLFRQWHNWLATHIYRVTESKELAEEVTQDVFLKIWMSRETLSAIENFKAYLVVVSRNQAINALKKRLRELQLHQQYLKDAPIAARQNSPDASSAFRLALIDEAIDKLPPRQKEIYLLHRHHRFNYQQIADKLGIGRESVKTHLRLAIQAIIRHVNSRLATLLMLFTLYFIEK